MAAVTGVGKEEVQKQRRCNKHLPSWSPEPCGACGQALPNALQEVPFSWSGLHRCPALTGPHGPLVRKAQTLQGDAAPSDPISRARTQHIQDSAALTHPRAPPSDSSKQRTGDPISPGSFALTSQ